MKRARPVALGVIAAMALAGTALLWQAASKAFESVPAVSYTLLDGRKTSTEALRGKVVLVNFWATSCANCVAEMPRLAALHGKFKDRGYDTLAVSMQYDAPASVAHFAASRRLPFGVAIDNTGVIAQRFGDVELTPTSFLIDQRGRIVKRFVGRPDFAALDELIEHLLAEAY